MSSKVWTFVVESDNEEGHRENRNAILDLSARYKFIGFGEGRGALVTKGVIIFDDAVSRSDLEALTESQPVKWYTDLDMLGVSSFSRLISSSSLSL